MKRPNVYCKESLKINLKKSKCIFITKSAIANIRLTVVIDLKKLTTVNFKKGVTHF